MQTFISVDIEGVASVIHRDQTKLEGIEYETARRWMTDDANAAIEGALAAGATEIVVADSHGHMRNLLVEELHPSATLIRGALKPLCMLEGLQSQGHPQTDAVLLVGYHAMAGTGTGILNHTFSGGAIYRLSLNGLTVGEVGFNAALAGSLGARSSWSAATASSNRKFRPCCPGPRAWWSRTASAPGHPSRFLRAIPRT